MIWLLTCFALITNQATLGTPNRLGEDLFAHPNDLASYENGQIFVLDDKLKRVFIIDKTGRVINEYGSEGQGPGELNHPIAIGYINGTIYIYDQGKGALLKMKTDGHLISEHRVSRGSFAKITQNHLIVHAPLGEHLFSIYDLNGKLITTLGSGMKQEINIAKAPDFIRVFSMEGNHLFAMPMKGGPIQRHSLSEPVKLKTQTLNFDFKEVSQKRNVGLSGPASFTIDNEMPIVGLQKQDEMFLLLVNDETRDNTTYLMVFNKQGHLVNTLTFPSVYRKMILQNDDLFLFDYDNATIDHFQYDHRGNQ